MPEDKKDINKKDIDKKDIDKILDEILKGALGKQPQYLVKEMIRKNIEEKKGK